MLLGNVSKTLPQSLMAKTLPQSLMMKNPLYQCINGVLVHCYKIEMTFHRLTPEKGVHQISFFLPTLTTLTRNS